MKRFYIATLAALMFTFTGTASVHKRCSEDWKEKMMCERIAFLSVELDLTQEEAQEFWPVYNEVCKAKNNARDKVFRAFKALETAVKSGKAEKEIEKLLKDYDNATEAQDAAEKEADEKLRKSLSPTKLAKLYIGEEKFRRQHIRKLHPQKQEAKK